MLLNCVAENQRCTMPSTNSILMAHFMTRKRSCHPRKTTHREDHSMRKIVMYSPKSSWRKFVLFMLKRYSEKFQHCFETSRQRISTEIPQTNTKKRRLPDVIAVGLSLSGRKCYFLTNASCSNLHLATCRLGGHWVSVLTRNML